MSDSPPSFPNECCPRQSACTCFDWTQNVSEALDKPVELVACSWQGQLHCVYLNDFRIAGGKPWGGGSTARRWTTTLREVIRAFPELQRLLGFDYLGHPVTHPSESGEVDQTPATDASPTLSGRE